MKFYAFGRVIAVLGELLDLFSGVSMFGQPFTVETLLLRICAAVVIGAAIGIDREIKNRPAGMRTHVLVCLGAALVALIEQQQAAIVLMQGAGSPVNVSIGRITSTVVTGVGFLGAGTILREGFSVKGLTTAASLWAVSCIGLAVGAGYYTGALVATVVIYLTLNTFKRIVAIGNHSKNLYIEAENMSKQAADIGAIIKRYGGNLHSLEVLYADSSSTKRKSDSVVMKAVVFPRDEESLGMTISAIRALEGIRDIYID